MGKTYDGKKRWNDTILATTARLPSGGGRRNSSKKRFSGRTSKLSASMRRVDDETRMEVRNARLDALEADNFGEDVEEGNGGEDGDDVYVDEGEDGVSTAMGGDKSKSKRGKRQRVGQQSRKRWKVKSLAQLVFEELGSGETSDNSPNYLTVAAEPPKRPGRRFCCVCGFFATYTCRRCGSRFCRVACGDQHKESGCLKFGL